MVFREVMVGPVEAVSLVKPSKPADEEKFALLIVAGCRLLRHRRDSGSNPGVAE
jgi:hypothetical protein